MDPQEFDQITGVVQNAITRNATQQERLTSVLTKLQQHARFSMGLVNTQQHSESEHQRKRSRRAKAPASSTRKQFQDLLRDFAESDQRNEQVADRAEAFLAHLEAFPEQQLSQFCAGAGSVHQTQNETTKVAFHHKPPPAGKPKKNQASQTKDIDPTSEGTPHSMEIESSSEHTVESHSHSDDAEIHAKTVAQSNTARDDRAVKRSQAVANTEDGLTGALDVSPDPPSDGDGNTAVDNGEPSKQRGGMRIETPTFTQSIVLLREGDIRVFEPLSKNPEVMAAGMALVKIDGSSSKTFPDAQIPTFKILTNQAHLSRNSYTAQKDGTVKSSVGTCSKAKPVTQFSLPQSASTSGTQEFTWDELWNLFQDFCDNPPTGTQDYYIGPTDIVGKDLGYEELLSCGPYMKRALKQLIPGFNSVYLYISCSKDPTATNMHVEDSTVLSSNRVILGAYKLWMTIALVSRHRFEEKVEEHYKSELGGCSQRVRHLNRLFPPRLLDKWGIEYSMKACGPGEIIFTMPGAYHQVINLGPNLAEAVNFMFETTPAIPPEYVFCEESICNAPGFVIERGHFFGSPSGIGEKRKAETDLAAESKRERIQAMERDKLHVGNHLIFDFRAHSPEMALKAILSKSTLRRLQSYIDTFRKRSETDTPLTFESLGKSEYEKAITANNRAVKHETEASLCILRSRVYRYHFATAIEMLRGGRSRMSDEVMATLRVGLNIADWRRLNNLIFRQHKLKQMCGKYGIGFLPLLPSTTSPWFYEVHETGMQKWVAPVFAEYHKQINNKAEVASVLKEMSLIGESIINMMTPGDTTLFRYELHHESDQPSDTDDWNYGDNSENDALTEVKLKEHSRWLLDRLKPLESKESKGCLSHRALRGNACEVCNSGSSKSNSCSCIATLPKNGYRITTSDNGHRFVIAGSTNSQELVFDVKSRMGELIGDFYELKHGLPNHTPCEGMFFAVSTSEGQCVAHLHWYETANWTRLVRHSCQPNAKFTWTHMSGRLRCILEATEPLRAGTVITADYSNFKRNELKTKHCLHCKGPCEKTASV